MKNERASCFGGYSGVAVTVAGAKCEFQPGVDRIFATTASIAHWEAAVDELKARRSSGRAMGTTTASDKCGRISVKPGAFLAQLLIDRFSTNARIQSLKNRIC